MKLKQALKNEKALLTSRYIRGEHTPWQNVCQTLCEEICAIAKDQGVNVGAGVNYRGMFITSPDSAIFIQVLRIPSDKMSFPIDVLLGSDEDPYLLNLELEDVVWFLSKCKRGKKVVVLS